MKLLKKHAAIKSIGGIVLLLIVFFAVVSVIGYNSFTEALLSQTNMSKATVRVRNTWKPGNRWISCAIIQARRLSM